MEQKKISINMTGGALIMGTRLARSLSDRLVVNINTSYLYGHLSLKGEEEAEAERFVGAQ